MQNVIEEKVNITDFELIQILGKGGNKNLITINMLTLKGLLYIFSAFGIVYLGRKLGGVDDGKLYAIKVIKKCTVQNNPNALKNTKFERKVL